jgi:phosphatidate cytidylyltransferase
MRARVLTAVALLPPVLAILFLARREPLGVLLALLVILGGRELAVFAQRSKPFVPLLGLGWIATTLLALAGYVPIAPAPLAIWAIVLACIGGWGALFTVRHAQRGWIPLELACLWIAAPLSAALLLQPSSAQTWSFANPLLLGILPVWAGDIAGIFAGRAFGRRPLAPRISPKKTLEGAIANLLAAVGTAALLGPILGYSMALGVAAGLACGILGQVGDLFESHLKRTAGVKDSGSLLPGHGGILDRIDSLLFAVPAVAALLILLG